jgi:hypothetical protein
MLQFLLPLLAVNVVVYIAAVTVGVVHSPCRPPFVYTANSSSTNKAYQDNQNNNHHITAPQQP